MSKKNNVIEIQPLIEKREEKIRVETQKKLMDEAIQNAINAPVAPTPSKKELFDLRLKQSTGSLEKPSKMHELRKDVARMKTILRERELSKKEDN